jgi:hypothetical protein
MRCDGRARAACCGVGAGGALTEDEDEAGQTFATTDALIAARCTKAMWTWTDTHSGQRDHNNFIGVDGIGVDAAAQFARGQASVKYNGGTLNSNTSFAGQPIISVWGENLWAVSTRWTLVNPGWRTGSWTVHYNCSRSCEYVIIRTTHEG